MIRVLIGLLILYFVPKLIKELEHFNETEDTEVD